MHRDSLDIVSQDFLKIKYFLDYYLQERKDLPVKKRIIKSLMASAKRCDSVCGPYVLIDTKNLEYEIIDMGGENY